MKNWLAISSLALLSITGCLVTPEDEVTGYAGVSSSSMLGSSASVADTVDAQVAIVVRNSHGPVHGATIWAAAPRPCDNHYDSSCYSAPIAQGTTGIDGLLIVSLPPGNWSFWADDVISMTSTVYTTLVGGQSQMVTLLFDNATPACNVDEDCADGYSCQRAEVACVASCAADSIDCDFSCPDIQLPGTCVATPVDTVYCSNDAGCGEGEICVWPEPLTWCIADGDCVSTQPVEAGICQSGERTPTACTMDYNPVCGKDWQTYSNSCAALAAGTKVAYAGSCEYLLD
jgi:hypothetical protein